MSAAMIEAAFGTDLNADISIPPGYVVRRVDSLVPRGTRVSHAAPLVSHSLSLSLCVLRSLNSFGADTDSSVMTAQWAVWVWLRRFHRDRVRATTRFDSASVFAEYKWRELRHLLSAAADAVRDCAAQERERDTRALPTGAPGPGSARRPQSPPAAASVSGHHIRAFVAADLLHQTVALLTGV